MFQQKTQILFILLSLSVSFVYGQKNALSKIDIDDLNEDLRFLSSDDLQGRMLGTAVDGLEIAANYIAEKAKQKGLKPSLDNYFQPVKMELNKPCKVETEINNLKGNLIYHTDELMAISMINQSGNIVGDQIVFVGFGMASLPNLEGKIVVLAQGRAEDFTLEKAKFWDSRLERDKIEEISKNNPKAIVFVANPNDTKNNNYSRLSRWYKRERYSLKSNEQSDAPVLFAKPEFADHLIGKKGDYKKYLNKVVQHKEESVLEIGNRMLALSITQKSEDVEAKNVIGVVEGSDPVLKNEYVIFMAHYDHLGIGKDGDVYNGADDNGSGTVALLEVAEAFASLKKKPKRSIVFLWVTCEEIGHLGSMYYCDNPIYPLEKTVLSVNLDMVGRVYENPRDDVYKNSPKMVKDFDGLYTLSNDVWPELAEINAKKCKKLGLNADTTLPKERFLRASDHYHFHKKGVPILNYATGYHADYHKVGDEIDKINFEKIKRVADLCFLLGYEVANLETIEY